MRRKRIRTKLAVNRSIVKLEDMLGYEKSQGMSEEDENEVSKNYRNGYSKKRVKRQLGEVDIRVSRGGSSEYTLQIIGKNDHNADGMEEDRTVYTRSIAAGIL